MGREPRGEPPGGGAAALQGGQPEEATAGAAGLQQHPVSLIFRNRCAPGRLGPAAPRLQHMTPTGAGCALLAGPRPPHWASVAMASMPGRRDVEHEFCSESAASRRPVLTTIAAFDVAMFVVRGSLKLLHGVADWGSLAQQFCTMLALYSVLFLVAHRGARSAHQVRSGPALGALREPATPAAAAAPPQPDTCGRRAGAAAQPSPLPRLPVAPTSCRRRRC